MKTVGVYVRDFEKKLTKIFFLHAQSPNSYNLHLYYLQIFPQKRTLNNAAVVALLHAVLQHIPAVVALLRSVLQHAAAVVALLHAVLQHIAALSCSCHAAARRTATCCRSCSAAARCTTTHCCSCRAAALCTATCCRSCPLRVPAVTSHNSQYHLLSHVMIV